MKEKKLNIIAVALTLGAVFLLEFGLPTTPVSLLKEQIDGYHQLSGCIFHPRHMASVSNQLLASLTFTLALVSSLIISPDSSILLRCISFLGIASITGLDSIIFFNIFIFNLVLLTYEKEHIKDLTLRTALLSSILLAATLYNGETSVIWIVAAIYFSRKKLNVRLIALLLAPLLIYLFCIPEAPVTPQLPVGAKIVPDDGVAGTLRPLFGPNAPDYQLCNRVLFKADYFIINLIVPIVFLSVYFFSGELPQTLLTLAIMVSIDIIFPESLAHIMPIATLQRLIPGYFFIPLQLHLLSLLIVRTSCLITKTTGMYLFALSILILSILSPTSKIILQNQKYHISQFPTGSQYPVIAGFDYVKPLTENKKYITLKSHLQVECSNPLNCDYIIDRDRSRRWYTRGQYGTEYIKLRLAKPKKIAGLRLYQDNFISDFPSRVQVSDCASNIIIVPPYDWLGSLTRTPNGELYFSFPATTVNIVLFKETTNTDCIEIKQVGYDPIHDWSTTEIELFK